MNIRTWWASKSTHKKTNWYLLALAICIIASGFVEAYSWIALIGAVPAIGLVYLECSKGE